jgi:hypothetical protein
MKRCPRTFTVVATVAVLAAGVGTASAKDPPPPDMAQPGAKTKPQGPSQGETAKEPGGTQAGHPHGGGAFLVYEALHENIGLSQQQRTTVEGLAQKTAEQPPPPAPELAKRTALANEVRAGKVDPATVQSEAQAKVAAMKERAPATAANLTTLHNTLSKDQRAKLVDAVEAKHAQHEEGAMGEKAEGVRGPVGYLLRGIDVTPAQKDQINAKLAAQPKADRDAMKAEHDSMKKQMDAKLQTFKGDNFDANAFVTPSMDVQQATQTHAAHFAKELQIAVSVLNPGQRDKLAQKIERGPTGDQQQ